jgi:hypothetical protein
MIATKSDPDAPVKCKVLKDFEIRGIHYRGDQVVTFRLQTAKLLALAGKISLLKEAPDALHNR